jgi:dihydroflavonol-4-reductase
MRAFVTGSTGLLGNHLVRLLAAQGHHVKALARSREKASKLFGDLDVTIVQGDLLDVSRFAPELAGCECLFHTAAYFREYFQTGGHWDLLEQTNITGTMTLLTEAERRGIHRVIYVSTAGVIGANPSGAPSDESTPPDAKVLKNLYFRSKALAEEAIDAFLQDHPLSLVFILPAVMFGPADLGPTSTGRIVLAFLARKIPGLIAGGIPMVDARDVAQAMLEAAVKGRSGDRYIVGGHYCAMSDLFKTLERVSGIPAPTRHVPYPMLLVYAWLLEMNGRLTGRPGLLSREIVQIIRYRLHVVSDKAMQELGVRFRSVEETLCDEVEWYRSQQKDDQGI